MKIPSELLLLLSDPLMGPAITKFVEDVKAHVEYAERSTRALKLIEALVTENDEFSAVAREAIMAIVDPVLDAALAQNPAPEECTTADRQPMAQAPVTPVAGPLFPRDPQAPKCVLGVSSVIDHADAWDVACYRRENSNLARAYIDAVQVIRIIVEFKRTQ